MDECLLLVKMEPCIGQIQITDFGWWFYWWCWVHKLLQQVILNMRRTAT